jgi:membrane protein DedA with SNARE-associated domain
MAWHGKGGRLSSIVSGLSHLSGWVAYSVIAALVFGETAVFLGFVLPGEAAVVLGAAFTDTAADEPELSGTAGSGRSLGAAAQGSQPASL